MIERWAAQGEIVQGNLRGVEIAYNRWCSCCVPFRHWYRKVMVFAVDLNLARTVKAYCLQRDAEIAVRSYCQFQALPTNLRLEFVCRASGNHASLIHDHDLLREVIGFLQILRGQQHGCAPVARSRMTSHIARRPRAAAIP